MLRIIISYLLSDQSLRRQRDKMCYTDISNVMGDIETYSPFLFLVRSRQVRDGDTENLREVRFVGDGGH